MSSFHQCHCHTDCHHNMKVLSTFEYNIWFAGLFPLCNPVVDTILAKCIFVCMLICHTQGTPMDCDMEIDTLVQIQQFKKIKSQIFTEFDTMGGI